MLISMISVTLVFVDIDGYRFIINLNKIISLLQIHQVDKASGQNQDAKLEGQKYLLRKKLTALLARPRKWRRVSLEQFE